jgi:type IV pilus assembly protein PilB
MGQEPSGTGGRVTLKRKSRLGKQLIQDGVISEEQYDTLLQKIEKDDDTALESGLIQYALATEEQIARALSLQYNIPFLRLSSLSIPPDVIGLVTEDQAREHLCCPVKLEGDTLMLAVSNPLDQTIKENIEFSTSYRVKLAIGTRSDIKEAIDIYYKLDENLEEMLQGIVEATDLEILDRGPEGKQDELESLETEGSEASAPVVKLVNLALKTAIEEGVSDIHVEPEKNRVQVRYRKDGILSESMQIPKWLQHPLISRIKILSNLDIAEKRLPQDGRIYIKFRGKEIAFRVSTLPTYHGEKAVLRLLDTSTTALGLDQLGLAPHQFHLLERNIRKPQGMILTTGPTGSGKTTTLYAALNSIKSPEVNIITVEDPVEYENPGINQVQINRRAGLTFASALRSILRQDPDVVLVGEIRDLETAEVAFEAAQTGHLVFSTLHTNDTTATILRLMELGLEQFVIAASLVLVMAQRLARRICTHCKERYTPPEDVLKQLKLKADAMEYWRGAGCERCGGRGYSGRVGIYEILEITQRVRDIIIRRGTETELRRAAILSGMRPMIQEAVEKIREGVTTPEEVLRVIQITEESEAPCPNCGRTVSVDFPICPYCSTQIKRVCLSCLQPLKPDWILCPYCRKPVRESMRLEEPSPAPETVDMGVKGGKGTHAKGPSAPPETAGTREAGPAPALAESGQPPLVLVADDDPAVRDMLRTFLRGLPKKVRILSAADGNEALRIAEEEKPDLLLLDVEMPGLTGIQVCEALRGKLGTAFIPIIMITAHFEDDVKTRAYRSGTDDFLSKPINLHELKAKIRKILRRSFDL